MFSTKVCFVLGCLLAMHSSFSQVFIEGKVLNQSSNEPVSFANVGVFKSEAGTLSNMDGSFSLRLSEELKNDSVSFSSVGFESKSIAVQTLLSQKNTTVHLVEKPTLLKEVVVQQKKERPKVFQLGNTWMTTGGIQTDTLYAGRSISLLIDNKDPKRGHEFPLYVGEASIRILRNNLNTMRFRVRIQDVAISGTPGNDLLQQNVVVESTKRMGWVRFDLSPLNLLVSGPFFITFEQLTTKEDRIAITNGYHEFVLEHPDRLVKDTVLFEGKKVVRNRIKRPGDLPGAIIGISPLVSKDFTCYVRKASFSEWVKVRSIVTATVTLSTHPVSKKK